MRNNETLSGNTGSLPKGMQFLQHGTPGPMPGRSEAELERADQAEYNLFVEDDYAEPAAEEIPADRPPEPADAPVGDMTASIASIVASVFAGAAASEPTPSAPLQQTASTPVVMDTADASRPLPRVDASEYAGVPYESGALPREYPEYAAQPEGYAEPEYAGVPFESGALPREYPEYDAQPEDHANQNYIPRSAPVPNPGNQQARKVQVPTGPAAARPAAANAAGKAAAGKAVTGNTGNAVKTGKTAKAGKPGKTAAKKAKISRDAARLLKESKPAAPTGGAPVLRPGTNYVNIGDSSVRDSASFKAMLQDLRERQKDALPDETVSVHSAMKTVESRLRIGRMLNPVRYVLILLMVLCLAGRKIEWMALGFMAGYPGTKFAIFITFVSMLVSWRAARNSVRDLVFFRAGYETWLLLATFLTAFEAVLHDNARSLMPVLAIAWCFAGIADYRNDQVQFRAERAMQKAKQRTGVRMKPVSKQKGRSMIGKSKASTTGFVRHMEEPDAFHKLWNLAGPVLFVLLLILAAYISGRTGKLYLTTLVLLMDMATPAALALCCVRPYELFVTNSRRHGVVAGWYGMQQLSGAKSMLLYDNDFYPSGSVKKKDVRLYTPIDIKTFVSYAACLGIKGHIGYDEMFVSMMREVSGAEVDVYGIKIFERGVQGVIHKEPVFLGSYEFMQLEGFNPPQQGSRDSLYLAVGKKLAGEITINYQVKRGAAAAFRHLLHEPGLYTMVAARNFMITPGYVGRTFKTNTGKLVCMKAASRRQLAQTATLDNSCVCGYVFREGIVSYSMITAGARRTYRAGFWMAILSIVSAVILILRTSLTLLGRYGTPTGIGLITLNIILLLICELVSRLAAGNPA